MTLPPIPLPAVEGDEISRQPVLMRALPRARFRGLGLKQLVLPQGMAETLEQFEIGLRLAGFVRSNELVCQTTDGTHHFRVQRRYVSIDGHFKPILSTKG